jgi:hypothetical protein
VRVHLPSWKDITGEGVEIEGVGLAPDNAVEWNGEGWIRCWKQR